MEDLIYELKVPFQYTSSGDIFEASFITLKPPCSKQLEQVVAIKQAVLSAVREVTDTAAAEGSSDDPTDGSAITGAQVLSLLYAGSGDVFKVFLHAKEVFKRVAFVEGETAMTVPLLDKMDIVDLERMTGEYITCFLAPSLLGGD